ncbi:MAG: YfhO family protein [Candidatus Hydrogenedens sp.]|nr:YfhO family protein [Candidatus Hydrogenedens sp.]
MTDSTHNQHAAPLLFMGAAFFIILCPLFWISVEAPGDGGVSAEGENILLYRQIFPSLIYGTDSLRTGKLPLWNNRILCGTPYFSEGRHGLFQPLILPFLFMDFSRALALHAFVALSATAFFFLLFARSLGLRFIPSLLGALIAVCGGTSAAIMSNPLSLQTVMWYPLVLWTLREHMHQPRRETLVLGALAQALLLFGGALMPALVLLISALLYGLFCVYWGTGGNESKRTVRLRLKGAGGLFAIFGLALLLFSIQGLPLLSRLLELKNPELLLDSFRMAASFPSGLKGLWTQMLDLQTQLLPAPGRFGVMTLLLIPSAFLHPLPRWERAFFALALPGIILLALLSGEQGWVQTLYLPWSFFMAVLAALGMDRLFTVRRNITTPRLWMPVILSALLFVILFILAPDSARGRMLPFVPALIFFLTFRRNWASVLACIFILVFLYVDLASSFVNRQDHPFFQAAPELRLDRRTTAGLRESALDGRVLLLADAENRHFHPNITMTSPLYGALGEGALFSSPQALWMDQWQTVCDTGDSQAFWAMLRLMAVQAVASDRSSPVALEEGLLSDLNVQQRNREGDLSIHSHPQGLSRAYWVPRWRLATDDQAALAGVCDSGFDPARECLVTSDKKTVHHLARIMADSNEHSEEFSTPRIVITEQRPEEITIRLDTPGPGILVFSESFEEGWRALENESPQPLLRVNGLFMGVALEKGSHSIRFIYRPPLFIVGGIISGLAAFFCVSTLLASRIRKLYSGTVKPLPSLSTD